MLSKHLQQLINSKFDDDVLANIVRKKCNWTLFDIVAVNLGEQPKKGDNYISTIVRFSIDVICKDDLNSEKKSTIHVISKSLPLNLAARKTFRSADFFNNEIAFYCMASITGIPMPKEHRNSFQQYPFVIHIMELGAESMKLLKIFVFSLLAFHHDGYNDFIALEDLSYQGYTSINRNVALDFKTTQQILMVFAKLHGLAYAFKRQHPVKFQNLCLLLQEKYFSEKYRNWFVGFMNELLKIVRDSIVRELPSMYIDKFEKLIEKDFFGTLSALCESDSPFTSVTHGDAWVPNFLACYNKDQTPSNIKMIDFQLARCSSSAMDILFFLYGCTDQELREKHWDTLMKDYFKSFTEFVKELGTDVSDIKYEDFLEELVKYAPFGMEMSFEACVMSLLDDDDVADLEKLQGDEGLPLESVWVLHPFKSSSKRKRLAEIVKHAVDQKFI